VLFSYSSHFRGPVEDRDEVGIEAGAAAYAAVLRAEEEDAWVSTWATGG
jgi:hypothetical protein